MHPLSSLNTSTQPQHSTFLFTDGTTMQIGTMYCIGKNYAAHVKEMGGDAPPEPLVFLKPPAAYLPSGGTVRIPAFSSNPHHEVELVVVIGNDCADIAPTDAHHVIAGYAVGLDMTLRDVQTAAKERGEPWAVAKGFVTSAPVSVVVPAARVASDGDGTVVPAFDLQLHVNDHLRQFGSTAMMERSVEQLIAYLSSVFTLRRGDCIFTGTPEGVAKVHSGDFLRAELNGNFSETVVLEVTIA
jgi:2-keto-4-pentenoate hydratase/2-oxohepta-3-ene-1,7-dioic acid hydratase in catechol pathway